MDRRFVYNPGMTLTYLRQGQLGLPMHLNGEKCIMSFKGKTCSKLANGLNFYDLKKTLIPGFACPGVIYMYITILVK